MVKGRKKSNCYYLNEQLAQYRLRKNSLSHRSFKKLLKYQYELFRIGEKMGAVRSAYHVAVNLIFGFLKKVFYSKKEK